MRKLIIQVLCAIVLFTAPVRVFTQNATQIRADKYYSTLNYAKAIPLYEALAEKSDPDQLVLVRLANCYRMTNNIEKAVQMYEKVSGLPGSDPIQKYYYAQALLEKKEYTKASGYLNQYNLDQRGENYSGVLNNIAKYYKDTANYKINKAEFNSKFHDFSPFILDSNKVAFISSRPTARLIKYTHGWTNYRYTHLFVVEKDKNGKYKTPKLFSNKVQTYLNNGPMTFSADHNRMIFTRNSVYGRKALRGGSGEVRLQLYQANYNQEKKQYLDILDFEYNDINYNYAHPSISQDGKFLFFSSDRPGGYGGMDIWVSIREGERWMEPVNLGQRVNTPGNEVFPYSFNNNKLYFSSDGIGGIGGLDIFEATLNSTGLPVGKAINMGANFNSIADDFGVVFKSDGKTGYLSSNREGVDINDDIYEFVILSPVNQRILIRGVAYDKETNLPVANAMILMKDENQIVVDSVKSNEKGEFTFQGEYEKEYSLIAEKENFSKTQVPVSTKNCQGKNEIVADIYMSVGGEDLLAEAKNATGPVTLNINIVDGNTSNPLAGVKVSITNKKSGVTEDYYTTSSGDVTKELAEKVGDTLNYVFSLSKQDYLPRERTFNYPVTKSGLVNIYESMYKPANGQEIGEAININPIYFDFDKYDIRPDAKIELDKIVKVMKQYPDMTIELGSHTDCRGTSGYNMELSEKRAKASKNYLIENGISKNRITGKGYGETKPVNNCYCDESSDTSPCAEDEHQKNRRTEFKIIKY